MAHLNVTSGLLLISWSPPAAGGANVTGYRIYYCNSLEGILIDELTVTNESQFVLDLKGHSLDNMIISIRAESAQLPSEVITANITILVPTPTITIIFGNNTAGDNYSLECSVNVTGSTAQPIITRWVYDGMEINSTDPTRMVSMTTGSAGSYSSTLMFSPLRASDAGMFVCQAILGDAMNSQSFSVAVQGKLVYGIINQ